MKVRLALLATLCAASPALAATFYVPLPESTGPDSSIHATVIWISNPGSEPRSATTRLLETGKPPGAPTNLGPIAGGRTSVLVALPKVGMLEVVGDDGIAVEARTRSTTTGGTEVITALPVIAAEQIVEARATTQILGLLRDPQRERIQHVGIMIPGNAEATCELSFFRADGSQIASTAVVKVNGASVRQFDDAFAVLGEQSIADVRAQVTCDKSFFPYGVLFDQGASQLLFAAPSVGGTVPFEDPLDPLADFVFERAGLFHTSSVANPKIEIKVPVAQETRFARVVAEVEFNIDRFNVRCAPTNHNILWLHRDQPGQSFRSNTIGNISAFNNDIFRGNQNIDLPPKNNTGGDRAHVWRFDTWYRLRYTYDAEGDATAELLLDGAVVASFSMSTTANNATLTVPSYGMMAEFGHKVGQHCPEVNSINMKYRNFRLLGYVK